MTTTGPKRLQAVPDAADLRFDDGSLNVGNAATVADFLRLELGQSALAGIFRRDGRLVFTPREGEDGYIASTDDRDDNGPAQIQAIDAQQLASRCQYTFRCARRVKDGDNWKIVPALFPLAAAKVPISAPDMLFNVRPLRGVVHAPIVRPDGTLLTVPGYDAATALLYLPEPGLVVPNVPDHPTEVDVRAAVDLLDYMLSGFIFASASDKANYLGLLMTPVLRELLPPPYKLGCVGAPMPGSGKSLLAAILRIVHGGVFRSEIPDDEAELRKQITTILDVTTGPVVQFDNVTGILRSSGLAGLLTSAVWDDRILGATKLVRAANDRLWVITGNNLTLGGDLIRRAIWVTIDPGVPDPHLRTGFAIANLEEWVTANRGQILHAILTLVRAWMAAGAPVELDRSDSYAKWSGTLRAILKCAGVAGTFDEAATARQDVGADDCDWSTFLAKVHDVLGNSTWQVTELIGKISANNQFDRPISSDLLPGDLADKFDRGHSITRSLGRWLMNREGRWAGGFAIKGAGQDRNKVKYWQVLKWEAQAA